MKHPLKILKSQRCKALRNLIQDGYIDGYWILLHWRITTALTTLYRDLYNALCNHGVGLNDVAKDICGKETT